MQGYCRFVTYLHIIVNLHLQNIYGETVLIIAVEKDHSDVADTLLAHNCNVDVQDNRELTPSEPQLASQEGSDICVGTE